MNITEEKERIEKEYNEKQEEFKKLNEQLNALQSELIKLKIIFDYLTELEKKDESV